MKLWDKGYSTDKKIDHFTVGNDRELDMVLAKYDIEASIAHAKMLGKIGLLTREETHALVQELQNIALSIKEGNFIIEDSFEDVHSKIEFILTERLGDTGKKIHTARSRNDQVLVAMQLYLKDELSEIKSLSKKLFNLLLELAEKHKENLLPGYTHLQIAMPSSFGLWFSAGYGSSFPIDRSYTTSEMGFADLKYNVIAAQMGRGKVEKAAAYGISGIAGTLSKLAMDVCLYMSQNFNFISFPDSLTTGSSIMPHKKNPDVFELIRAKCNSLQAIPGQITLITSNLPSGYHRDLQMVKGLIIPAIQEIKSCLEMMTFSLKDVKVNTNILNDTKYDYLFSVDTLNHLVLKGIPFREAYKQIGSQIEAGNFKPEKQLNHTHEGSIGNLCLDKIRAKMKS
ncbi:argininosuccinate lyase [uncultured Eudoraea sp.]|uniref:argininosuccinate lyase n=1 Tax=uncultured Eudoraea sp. TaxID=1035614 RepID=UPI0026226AB8|nr:argininosuccinate lyase [uncultured Eudoraea sp.]